MVVGALSTASAPPRRADSLGLWASGDTLPGVLAWLQGEPAPPSSGGSGSSGGLGFACFIDTKPRLWALAGGCWVPALEVRYWSNVFCAHRSRPDVLRALYSLSNVAARLPPAEAAEEVLPAPDLRQG